MANKNSKPRSQRHLSCPRAQRRRAAAAERRVEQDARSPEEQLARLDKAFGAGNGAAKERAKLVAKITAATAKPDKKVKK